ncbi:hypothetical protein AGLY_003989 [Aphis glycines]|uniref:Uncharacterized protein n=1 Tax=Aphis glycines TaxID=307491 RepID=A0A6G0TXA4_APHGL|nr:hypothetical protein AGLY_003989 [Aphis glycines]
MNVLQPLNSTENKLEINTTIPMYLTSNYAKLQQIEIQDLIVAIKYFSKCYSKLNKMLLIFEEKFMENLVPNFQNLVIKEKNFMIFQLQNYLQIFAFSTDFIPLTLTFGENFNMTAGGHMAVNVLIYRVKTSYHGARTPKIEVQIFLKEYKVIGSYFCLKNTQHKTTRHNGYSIELEFTIEVFSLFAYNIKISDIHRKFEFQLFLKQRHNTVTHSKYIVIYKAMVIIRKGGYEKGAKYVTKRS